MPVANGIDIGSRTIKTVTLDLDTGEVVASAKAPTTFNPLEEARKMMERLAPGPLIATGYGRRLIQGDFGGETITEIQAHALGAKALFPDCTAILDIGGQDTKVISLDKEGRLQKFEMNDRCAAGTGKFLEFMAVSFQVPIEEFGRFALEGAPGTVISSLCTVFAEAEATSLMARGQTPKDIARALHLSVVKRSVSMLRRITDGGALVFSGGVARNPCIAELLRRELGTDILVPNDPDMVGALGAALHAVKQNLEAG
jgi:predicted CoA-substrate-specific enzyme activase